MFIVFISFVQWICLLQRNNILLFFILCNLFMIHIGSWSSLKFLQHDDSAINSSGVNIFFHPIAIMKTIPIIYMFWTLIFHVRTDNLSLLHPQINFKRNVWEIFHFANIIWYIWLCNTYRWCFCLGFKAYENEIVFNKIWYCLLINVRFLKNLYWCHGRLKEIGGC